MADVDQDRSLADRSERLSMGEPPKDSHPRELCGLAGPDARRPVRIQRQRTKGWRMPPNTVYVGRPTKWGNPFRVSTCRAIAPNPEPMWEVLFQGQTTLVTLGRWDTRSLAAADAVDRFRRLMREPWADRAAERELLSTLRGKNLACWCPLDQPCHADVLLEIANVD